jgi:adenylate cyclase/guanylate cyclase
MPPDDRDHRTSDPDFAEVSAKWPAAGPGGLAAAHRAAVKALTRDVDLEAAEIREEALTGASEPTAAFSSFWGGAEGSASAPPGGAASPDLGPEGSIFGEAAAAFAPPGGAVSPGLGPGEIFGAAAPAGGGSAAAPATAVLEGAASGGARGRLRRLLARLRRSPPGDGGHGLFSKILGRLEGFTDKASWQRLRITLAGSVLLAAVAVTLSVPGTDLPGEGPVYDLLVKTRLKLQPPGIAEGIVIIAVDDASRSRPQGSMAEIFSPGVYAEILDALVEGGAAALAIHRNLPSSEARMYMARDEMSWWSSFGNARDRNVPVIYGFRYRSGIPVLPSPLYVEVMGRDTLAFMNLPLDRDLKVRSADVRWPSAVPGAGDEFLSFAYLSAQTVNPDLRPPAGNRFQIDFRDSILRFSFADIYQKALNGQLDFFKQHFRGALVLIGETSSLDLDTSPVPLSTFDPRTGWDLMPAVEIQAHAANTLLKGRTLTRPAAGVLFGFFFGILFITLTPILFSPPQGPYRLQFLPPAILLAYPVAAAVAFNRYVALPVVPGVFAILLAHALYLGMRWTETRRLAATRTKALNLYLDPALAGRIIADPDILSRRGERRACTIFFSDFEGFTAASETMNTEDMVDLVNLYYEIMTAEIERCGGFVDKFVGDAVMAVWGAPADQPGHAALACVSALAQQARLEELNAGRRSRGEPALKALMGVNTGAVIAGNIGSSRHKAYTVMGDSVNLASRLVSVNKLFKTAIIASEAVVREASDSIVFRPLDRVRVVGRRKSINIYEVMARKGELRAGGAEMIGFFERALRHYWARDFPGALARFERAHRILPDDLPSQIFMDRCRTYIRHEPDENWDGVTVLGLK